MRRQLFATIVAAALVVGFAGVGNAASPASGSVGPTSHSVVWSGRSYTVGATQDPSACPQSADSSDSLCDHYDLKVNASTTYWRTHTGSVGVSIHSACAGNDFNLYVYRGGSQVASSAQSSGTSEPVSVVNPARPSEGR